MIWFTSDLHFCHDREFIYKPRGFNSLYDMEEYVIEDWQKVADDDIVYVLGDFALGMDEHRLNNIISRLKGNIKLIIGNHDTDNKLQFYKEKWGWKIDIVGYATIIKYKKRSFYLSHYITLTGNLESDPKKCIINVSGHTHSKEPFYNDMPFVYNVALDAHNNKLISIDDIYNDIDNKIKECLKYLK